MIIKQLIFFFFESLKFKLLKHVILYHAIIINCLKYRIISPLIPIVKLFAFPAFNTKNFWDKNLYKKVNDSYSIHYNL